ncbi:MAG: hypothetical protein DI603_08120 [Roseateles depolymerans]|uniref:Solute-binding protein family 3/N-terminal domain-containing protein n=1 Tax=Roseateles depolymerans TaxID=76731 RepID=A0A2W5DRL9_9BURK|nr:MAG: hypothetical protein DI603_08120 [Roseateles depolymerans]
MGGTYTGPMPRAKYSQPTRRLFSVLLAAGGLPGAVALAVPGGPAPALRGYTEHLAPLNYAEDGRASGLSSELLQLMASEAGLPLNIEVMPWQRAVQAAAREPNSVLFSLTRTPEREARYQWVGPILPRRILLYRLSSRPEVKPASLGQLQGLRVGVVRDSAAAKHLVTAGLRPDVDLEFSLDDHHNLRKLLAGRMDLIALLDWAATWQLHRLQLPGSTLTPVLPLDVDKAYWYGLPAAADPALVRRLQDALDRLRRDGRYEQLRLRHLG